MLRRLIEYCLHGVSDQQKHRIRESDAPSRSARCLEHCGICDEQNLLVVDGNLLVGPAADAWVDALDDADTDDG